ncbi:MAG: sugar ABC transporter substrate-binding protein [Eubacterium sp.]|nr:sugar ABC transporter substrate-binding protein [Eubacterium sp.]
MNENGNQNRDRNHKKRLSVALAACLGAAAISGGCGDASEDAQKDMKMLITISEMDTFRQTLADAAQQAAQQQGISLEVMDAQGVVENQVDQIQKAAKEGYDAVLCGAIDVDTAVELKASAGGMPIVFVNSCPNDKNLEKDAYMYVGSDDFTAGEFQAQYVLDKLASKNEINVMLLKGPTAHSATIGRTKGVKKTFAASGKQVNYVFEDNADWSTDKAAEMFEIFLQTGKQADCVICNNDSMALGVVQACKKAGIDPASILILGVDATADGCAAIESGEMAFTVYQSGKGQGQAAVKAAAALAAGASIDELEGVSEDGKYVWVPFEKVDGSNVGKYMQ